MTDDTRMQLDIIMKRFKKMKNEKMALTADNNELKVECRNLRERHCKSEKHRHTLIKLCSESTQRNKARIQSLERENKNLRDIVEDQNHQIEEHSKKFNKLQKELEVLRKNKDELSDLKEELQELKKEKKEHDKLKEELRILKKEREEQKRYCLMNHIARLKSTDPKPKQSPLKKELVGKLQSFTHPSFEDETKMSRAKRKLKSLSQLRWANLDIQVNGHVSKKEDNNNLDSSKLSKEKKRKLYCSNDDATVDLTTEEE